MYVEFKRGASLATQEFSRTTSQSSLSHGSRGVEFGLKGANHVISTLRALRRAIGKVRKIEKLDTKKFKLEREKQE